MTLDEQIACIRREIAMRERAYPKWIASGKLKGFKAEHEIAAMKAVLKTLEKAAAVKRLWLWREGDNFLAYDHKFPCVSPGCDPLTLGEPAAWALWQESYPRGPHDD